MYFAKTPEIIKPLGKDFLWDVRTDQKEVYLTFDDGPTPVITEKVLALLKTHHARATFFCLGKNVEAHPELYQSVLNAGHSVGNHSDTHPDGWKTCTFSYVRNVLSASKKIDSKLFRPPYGHITFSQASLLKKKFQIVMWDIISGDFDQKISAEKCLSNVISHVKPGSIIVFHDNEKSHERMFYALEKTLELLGKEGYSFKSISMDSGY